MEGYGYEEDRDPRDGLLCPGAPGVMSEEIYVDQELVTILSHRCRRRLRELQSSCKVAARLDRNRQVVYLTGTADALKAARQAIESLSGPKRSVPLAVWAELMRTRTMSLEDLTHSGGLSQEALVSVAWVQENSGCRLHIERGACEVKIFGSNAGTEVASKLVDDMIPLCAEESVAVQDLAILTSPVLQSIAHACSATFRVQSSSIVVLGLTKYVGNAVEQLHKFLAMPQSYSLPEKLSQAKGPASRMPLVMPEVKEAENANDFQPKHHENVCPTCKCGPFCSHCGQMLWKNGYGFHPNQPSQVASTSGPMPYQFVVMQPMEAGNMKNMNNMNSMMMPANMMQSMPSMQNMQTMQSSMMPVCMPMAMMTPSDLAAGG